MVDWEFSASAYFVNVYYASWLNESYWDVPPTVIVDDCGPPNIISSGYALWLALVPAVGCAVQLPGSTFLYRRSNFYRFAPEIGLADCLATLILTLKALWRGYRWKESVAAVLLVREGIGDGELWWREGTGEDHAAGSDTRQVEDSQTGAQETGIINEQAESEEYGEMQGAHAEAPNEEAEDDEGEAALPTVAAAAQNTSSAGHEAALLASRLEPYTHSVSNERMIGSSLFVMSLVKTIAIFATAPESPTVRLAACIALSYSVSFLVIEALLWSLVFVTPDLSLIDVPYDNLVQLLREVDPGDNPFTFPRPRPQRENAAGGTDVEMQNTHGGNQATEVGVPWNKAVAVCASTSLVFGPLIWAFLLRNIWLSSRPVSIIATAGLAYFALRMLWTLGHVFDWQPRSLKLTLQTLEVYLYKVSPMRLLSLPPPFLLSWLVERLTTVNLFSALWLVLIIGYYAGSFGQNSSGENGLLLKPMWLDWLG